MGKAIPVLIGLLASILGIGGLANKVMGLIKKIRQRIVKAITAFWKKVKKGARKLLSKFKKGGAKKIKEDNKKEKAEKVTAKDRVNHKKIADKIEKALKKGKKRKEQPSFDEIYREKKKEAGLLEDKYQPELKKGINLDIDFKPLPADKEDNDIDVIIRIAPNDEKRNIQINLNTKEGEQDITLTSVIQDLDRSKTYEINYVIEGNEKGKLKIAPGAIDIENLLNKLKKDSKYDKKLIAEAISLWKSIDQIKSDTAVEKSKDITKKLKKLATTIATLFKVNDVKLPTEGKYTFGSADSKPKFAFGQELTSLNSGGGSPPNSKKGTKGYDLIVQAGRTNFWVQMHLIMEKAGGPGEPKNLIPGPKTVNTGIFSAHEEVQRELLGKDKVAADKRAGKTLTAKEFALVAPVETQNVIWLSVEVTDFHPANTDANNVGFNYDDTAFAKTIKVNSGIHIPDESGTNWKLDKEVLIENIINVEAPNFLVSEIPNINKMSLTQMQVVLGIGGTSAKELREEIKSGEFEDYDDLEAHIKSSFNQRQLKRWNSDLVLIENALKAKKIKFE